MKKLLNTVYVTTEGAALRKDGENLVADVEGETKARVPLHMIASVVTFGPILVSPALIGACAGAGITLVLLDRVGRFQARIEGPVSGNVLLRRAQYRASEAPEEIVRSLLVGKVANQRAVLLRALRDYGTEMEPADRAGLEAVVERIALVLRRQLQTARLQVVLHKKFDGWRVFRTGIVMVDHLLQSLKTSVMHIRGTLCNIAQGGCFEFCLVGRIVCYFLPADVGLADFRVQCVVHVFVVGKIKAGMAVKAFCSFVLP